MVIFINQIRMKIGVMFGSPETTTGGNALKFYASVRLDIRRIGSIKKGDDIIGNETKVKVVKNKVSPPSRRLNLTSCTARHLARGRDHRHGRECQDRRQVGCPVRLRWRKNWSRQGQRPRILRENPIWPAKSKTRSAIRWALPCCPCCCGRSRSLIAY